MNASRLREIVDLLLRLEDEYQIQTRLNEVNSILSNIIGNPQEPTFQIQFSSTVEQLRSAAAMIREKLQPTQISLIEEIGGGSFFVVDLSALIDEWVQKNAVTPAVTQHKIHELLVQRQNYIQQITQLRDALKAVGIEATTLNQGEAEIGILLPRALFRNEFEPLIKELGEIKFILRAFSELAMGSAEPIEVRQISTSDPQFFFQMNPITIALIGGVVTWALDTWKRVEEVRKVRSETRKLSVFSEKEVTDIFDKKIKSTIDEAIEKQTDVLVEQIVDKTGRTHEQREHLKSALESILARIERGMTVEIRFLPSVTATETDEKQTAESAAFTRLENITQQLVFPKADENPILKLSDAEQKKAAKE